MSLALRKRSEFSRRETRRNPIASDNGSKGGEVMLTQAKWAVLGLAAFALAMLATDCLPSAGAAPSRPVLMSQALTVSQAELVDRSGKADRLVPAHAAVRAVLPSGCEFPFSGQLRVSQSDVIARCVT